MSEIVEIKINEGFFGSILINAKTIECVYFSGGFSDSAVAEDWSSLTIERTASEPIYISIETEKTAKRIYSEIKKLITA
jgi:hypothetical protein